MAGPFDLTGQNIENTYQRVLQTPDGVNVYDGTGSAFTFTAVIDTGSLVTTSSFNAFTSSINNFTASYNTGSFSGSFTGSLNGTAATASYYQETDPVFVAKSASLATTGSNIFIGNQTVTGSLFTTGSNTLVGNTILSGTLQIQGEYPPSAGSESVSIVGNVDLNGYLRFDPVTSNINQALSASYIYVSGSTNDLYFTQNGNGYANTTRLRWLEGNLYTGLLHGGIISQINSTTYQISSGSGVIVNLNASYNDDPYPTIKFLNWSNLSASIAPLSASFDQSFVAINSNTQITASGIPYNDGDYNTLIPIGIIIHQNRSTINAFQTFPSVGYGWKQRSYDFIKAFGPLKIANYNLTPSSSRGLLLGGGTAWVDGRNYTVDPNNPSYIVEATGITTSKIFRYRQSGSGWVYDTNAGVGYTTIDPTQYSNTGSLTPVPSNHWSIQRVFYFPNSATKAFYVYYGNAAYSSKDNAIAGLLTEPFNEAPNTFANAIFVGHLILRNNADFTTAASYEFRAGGLFRGVGGGGGGGGGGGSTTLAGLTDVSLTSPTYGDLLMYDTTVWNNTKQLTGSYGLTGSLNVSGSITSSLLGTASYATYALNGGVTQILAGQNISLSPTNGLGQVTITSTGGGGVYGNTATGSYGSFYDTTIQSIGTVGAVYSMSLNTTDISNGVSISGSVSPYNTYIKTANAGVYDIQFSAQLDKTSGQTGIAYIWLRKNGVDLAETNTAVTLAGGANDKAIAAWNWFVNASANDYFQIVWAADNNNIRLYATGSGAIDASPAIPSVIVTVNRVDQFLSNTGSFSGSFHGEFTGSLLGTASTASYFDGVINGGTF